VKVQYPEAASLFDADIQSIKLLIALLEPEALQHFDQFAAQLREELHFRGEAHNLQLLHDAVTPVFGDQVVIPELRPEFCSDRVITMSFIQGEKLDRTIQEQLAMLADGTAAGDIAPGLDKLIGGFVGRTEEEDDVEVTTQAGPASDEVARSQGSSRVQHDVKSTDNRVKRTGTDEPVGHDTTRTPHSKSKSLTASMSMRVLRWIGPDAALSLWRSWTWVVDSCTSVFLATALAVETIAPRQLLGAETTRWVHEARQSLHRKRVLQDVVNKINVLFDVHAFELFEVGTFNADPHPGNLIAASDGRIGLIDYGQCTAVSVESRTHVAELMVAVASGGSDDEVADAMRALGVESKENNSVYLATMARLMFDRLRGEYLDEAFHVKLHQMDRIVVIPKDLGMVARVAALLRGLALTLHHNVSVADMWNKSAQAHLLRVQQQPPP
jgi:hypothetical protein